jgi:hypothetical protein
MRQARGPSAKAPRRKEKVMTDEDADVRIKLVVLSGMLKNMQAFATHLIRDSRQDGTLNKVSLDRIKNEILFILKDSTVSGLDNDQQVLLYFNRCEKGLRQLMDEAIREGMVDEKPKPA